MSRKKEAAAENPPVYAAFTVLAGQGDEVVRAMTEGGDFKPMEYADYLRATLGFQDANLKPNRFRENVGVVAFVSHSFTAGAFERTGALATEIVGGNARGVVEYAIAAAEPEKFFRRGTGPVYQKVNLR